MTTSERIASEDDEEAPGFRRGIASFLGDARAKYGSDAPHVRAVIDVEMGEDSGELRRRSSAGGMQTGNDDDYY